MNNKKIRRGILHTINKSDGSNKLSFYFDVFIIVLIILNVFAVIIETVEVVYLKYKWGFYIFELFSILIFSIEYLMRIWTCTLIERYRHPLWGRIKYVFSLEALIDLFAILPFYLPIIFTIDSRSVRILRLFRLLRIFKLGRYSTAFISIINVIKNKKEELITSLTFIIVILILSSSVMYYVENEAQPKLFTSIPATMWWAVATLTTVGYGDVFPITPLGKLLGAFIAVLGVGLFALPAGIIASGFNEETKRLRGENDETKD